MSAWRVGTTAGRSKEFAAQAPSPPTDFLARLEAWLPTEVLLFYGAAQSFTYEPYSSNAPSGAVTAVWLVALLGSGVLTAAGEFSRGWLGTGSYLRSASVASLFSPGALYYPSDHSSVGLFGKTMQAF